MAKKLNRIKVILADRGLINKWLAEAKVGKHLKASDYERKNILILNLTNV